MKTYEFGKTKDDKAVTSYVIENINGIRAEFLDYGCVLRQLWVLKPDEAYVNIIYGFDSVKDYESFHCAGGGQNHLNEVLRRKVFDAEMLPAKTLYDASSGIVFKYHSSCTEDGFPGSVDMKVTCILDDMNVLHMDYEAVSDMDEVVDFTNRSCFNLGAGQIITVDADTYLETDGNAVPTGKVLNVSDHEIMDLRNGKDPEKEYPENGYFDHCYILNHAKEYDVRVYAPGRGITMLLKTSEPAVQIYSGNNTGVAIEPQMYPCVPDYPGFPSCNVLKGQVRRWSNSLKIIV